MAFAAPRALTAHVDTLGAVVKIAYPAPKPFWQALMEGEISTGTVRSALVARVREDLLRSLAAQSRPGVEATMPKVSVR